jgi:DNA-binding GntR family transcriptional regulator
MSGLGKQAGHLATGDASIRRRIDVTRLFTHRPGERLTVKEVCDHTTVSGEKVRELLEELTNTGWLQSTKDEDHRVVYWRDG